MKTFATFLLVIAGIAMPTVLPAQFVSHHNAVYQGDFAQPARNVLVTDPNFHTQLIRLTNARSMGISGMVPDYSKRQAWNSDESLLMLRSGWGDTYLFNGSTYELIKTLDGVAGEDVFWDPGNPRSVLYCPDSVLYRYNVDTDQVTKVHDFAPFNFANTGGEGNLTNDGRYFAIAQRYYNYTTGEVTFAGLIVYDIWNDQVISSMNYSPGQVADFDWVTISPLGNYVVVDYASWEKERFRGLEVYDRNFNLLWQKGLGPGHSDLGIDSNGDEVLIMDVYNENDNLTHICKFRLANGDSTELLTIPSAFDLHESCRSMWRPGWVLVSTFDYVGRLTDGSTDWLPFEDEIFALKMDGSGTVQRYAHHRSKEYSTYTPDRDSGAQYFAEPHATFSRSGNRIIFASNWRIAMNEEASIDAYLVDLRNLITGVPQELSHTSEMSVELYPNPVSGNLNLSTPGCPGGTTFCIYDGLGRKLKETLVTETLTVIDLTALPPGVYFYRVTAVNGTASASGKFLKI